MKKFFIGIYEYLFYSELKKQSKRYWTQVRENQKNSTWEYLDKVSEEGKAHEDRGDDSGSKNK